MSYTGFYNKRAILQEGQYYFFKYLKCVTLDDNNDYMVFEDEYNIKYFVEYEPYKLYSLEPSSLIKCFIDKINCTGRVFLEPEHPEYHKNKSYYFDIKSVNKHQDILVLSVIDCFNNIIEIKTSHDFFNDVKQKDKILARILRIKKGVPELTFDDSQE